MNTASNDAPGLQKTNPGLDLSRKYRAVATGVLLAALALAGIAWIAAPEWRSLVGYFLYAIPSHLLISVLANEPALFAAAKASPPAAVAIAGTLGCVVAIVLDYALIGWFTSRQFVRTELDDSRGLRAAQRFFGRAPFVLILLSALLPVPFYPVKILAIVRDYPLTRFIAALVLGRLPRFYLLALGGQKIQAPDSALVSAGVTLGLFAAWGVWRTVRRNRKKKREAGSHFPR
jgi:membrane protein YqaA with SNARE-associated domain